MTPEERTARLCIGTEILEKVILNYLGEHPNTYFRTATVSLALGCNYHICTGLHTALYQADASATGPQPKPGATAPRHLESRRPSHTTSISP